jgi:hypothetical protein
MKTFQAHVLSFSLATLLLLAAAPGAKAQSESCDECKYLRCLKSTVQRKQALLGVYRGIQSFWGPHAEYDMGSPQPVIDFSVLAEPKRSQVHVVVMSQLAQYAIMEAERTSRVPGAEGCGYPAGGSEVETNVLNECTTSGLVEAMGMQPCKELADLLAAHEGMHAAMCEARQKPKSKGWDYIYVDKSGVRHTAHRPPKIQTPYGAAASEIAAYRMEIDALKPIIDKLDRKCREISFKDVTIDCVMSHPRCKVRMGQKLAGSACGDPVKANWIITPQYFAEGCGIPSTDRRGDKPFDNDCVTAGSDEEKRRAAIYAQGQGMGGGGWMCVYSDSPRPQITIRNFRMSLCQGPKEQKVTVDARVGGRCDDPAPSPAPRPVS